MTDYLGADHRGFKLKESVKKFLKLEGYTVVDLGAEALDPEDDYVDYAQKVAESIKADDRGIIFCGSGHGMDIVANRYPHIRSIIGFNFDVVVQGREHEDANVLCLPTDWLDEEEVKDMGKTFLDTGTSHDSNHLRRREKLSALKV